MAQNISLWGANYSNVPAVDLPKTGGGEARFADPSITTAVEADVASGKIFLKADGSQGVGTGSGGGTPVGIIASGGTITVDTSRTGVLTIPHGLGKRPLAMCLFPITDMTNNTGTYSPVGGFATYADGYKGNIFPSTVQVQNSTTYGNTSFGLYISNGGNTLRPTAENMTMGSSNSYFRTPDETNLYYAANAGDGMFLGGLTFGWWAVAESDEGGGGGEPILIEKTITANGTYAASSDNADGYSSVTVNVPSGTPTLQTKSVSYTPTTSQQTASVTADSGYDGLDAVNVTVSAMPTGTAGTPTATKGSVSNHSVTVTPSVTNSAGYISGGTKTGTAVTVTAAELESGTLNITENGTVSCEGYANVSVNVSGGGTGSVWQDQNGYVHFSHESGGGGGGASFGTFTVSTTVTVNNLGVICWELSNTLNPVEMLVDKRLSALSGATATFTIKHLIAEDGFMYVSFTGSSASYAPRVTATSGTATYINEFGTGTNSVNNNTIPMRYITLYKVSPNAALTLTYVNNN